MNIKTNHQNFFIKISVILFTSLLLSGWSLISKYQSLPVETPFDLTDVKAKKEVFFKVKKDGDYEFNLDFLYKDRGVRLLMENSHPDELHHQYGEPIEVSIDIYKIENNQDLLVAFFGSKYLKLCCWGEYLTKNIGIAWLANGDYKVVITNKKGNTKFKGIPTNFVIIAAHKAK